jgi:hypothetical protein
VTFFSSFRPAPGISLSGKPASSSRQPDFTRRGNSFHPGADPTTLSYNANVYCATNSMARFYNNEYVFSDVKTLQPTATLALYVAVHSKVVGLGPVMCFFVSFLLHRLFSNS